jgi:hypothetical protein
MTIQLDKIGQMLESIARGKPENISSLIENAFEHEICENKISCYHLKVDGNGRPRLPELIKFVCQKITDYAIPRSKIRKAIESMVLTGSTEEIARLTLEARRLFTKLELTGEGGELLLFSLTECILKYPQILCKMNLKTDEQVHFHGADGVFLGVDDDGCLCVYWGESKLHATHSSALSECIESISSILKMEGEVDSDIRLIDYIDLDDSVLEDAIKEYFNYNSPNYDKLRSCAVCLVAFDHSAYIQGENKVTNEFLKSSIKHDFDKHWKKNIEAKLIENGIHHSKIIFFYLPVSSVSDFRLIFRQELGLV